MGCETDQAFGRSGFVWTKWRASKIWRRKGKEKERSNKGRRAGILVAMTTGEDELPRSAVMTTRQLTGEAGKAFLPEFARTHNGGKRRCRVGHLESMNKTPNRVSTAGYASTNRVKRKRKAHGLGEERNPHMRLPEKRVWLVIIVPRSRRVPYLTTPLVSGRVGAQDGLGRRTTLELFKKQGVPPWDEPGEGRKGQHTNKQRTRQG